MAKLIYTSITSLDGYVADESGSLDWSFPDEEVHAFVNDLERPIGTHLYGRRCTRCWWPGRRWTTREPAHARLREDLARGGEDRLLADAEGSRARGRGSSGSSTPTRSAR